MLETCFLNRILSFDSGAARTFAGIATAQRDLGWPVAWSDCQNAAVARSHHMALATRNTADFEWIEIVDPWAGI